MSDEARKKLSEARRGKKLSEEGRIRFLEGKKKFYEDFIREHGHHPNKGRHPKTEFKKGNTLWVGRHHTPESKRKLSFALTGRLQSAETRAKKSKAHLGKSPWNKGLTRETNPSLARIGDAQKKAWTPERRRILAKKNTKFWNEWWPGIQRLGR